MLICEVGTIIQHPGWHSDGIYTNVTLIFWTKGLNVCFNNVLSSHGQTFAST